MRTTAALAIALALMILAGRAQAGSTGVLFGAVTRGPLTPVQRPGMRSQSPVAGARIDVMTLDGKPVTSVETDSIGSFRIEVPAGTYRLTMPSLHGAMFTKDLPATVSVSAGEKKRVDIHLDTGIR